MDINWLKLSVLPVQPLPELSVRVLNFVFILLQRGSDELLSQSGVTVMAPAAPHHADNNNQDSAAKKVR